METSRILIVGSGVSGAVLALALHKLQGVRPNHQLEIILVDAASSFRAVGAGFCLSANAVRPLRQLGILDKLSQVSQRCPRIGISDEKSRTSLASFVQPPLMYGQPLLTVERAKLQEVVLSELAAAGIVIQFNKRLESLSELTPSESEAGSESAKTKVEVKFADGSSETVDLVVGADGAWSRVRDFVDSPSPAGSKEEEIERTKQNLPHYSGWCGVVGVSEPIEDISDDHLGETHWIVPKSGKGGYGTWGLPDHRQFWYIIESDHRPAGSGIPKYAHADLQASIDRLSSSWHPLTGNFSKVMEATKPERMAKIPLVQRVYPKIVSSSGRIVLIGDAAHPMTPFLGQGAAMGIEDAIVLANALLPPDGAEARGAHWYAEQRVKRTAAIVKQGITTGKLNMAETMFWRAARWIAFNALKLLISMIQKRREGGPQQPTNVEENSDQDRGPLAWVHREKFELEM